jgi:hypothetical protein
MGFAHKQQRRPVRPPLLMDQWIYRRDGATGSSGSGPTGLGPGSTSGPGTNRALPVVIPVSSFTPGATITASTGALSPATPVYEMPGWTTPTPVELGCGALGLACANAAVADNPNMTPAIITRFI